jgi:3-deoxy-D-manno-octulosonic-acid transferase
VEALVRTRGLPVVRRSRIGSGTGAEVILLDTVGELASLYAVADVIFVGGSLVPVGGHNVIEPALFGKPVVFGPHMHNFRDAAGLLVRTGGGIQVPDGPALVGALRGLLVDEIDRRTRGEAAWRAVSLHQGACQRTVDALAGLLEGGA